MLKNKIRVGIIGCGMIFDRHIEAIKLNKKHFELVSICDIDEKILKDKSLLYKIPGFLDYVDMLNGMKGKMDLVSICTPNSYHYQQALDSLEHGFDILVEKPIDFKSVRVEEIVVKAKRLNKNAYAVLQVRFNPAIVALRNALKQKLIGEIRSVSLIQRWQRPSTYFDSWRADIKIGGRTLYEVGIHYLDIVQLLFGIPDVLASATFNNKHSNVRFEDTIFALLDFNKKFSGSVEVTIAAEPSNLECSLSVMANKGYIKIGGRALDQIDNALFLSPVNKERWLKILTKTGKSLDPNSYGTHVGSCPNHPMIYKEISGGRGIRLDEAVNSIKFIESIYDKDVKR